MFEEACRKGWEGVIAKRADSVYTHGALARLAEVQVRAGPGARDRRLHRAARLARGVRRAARRLLRRDGELRYAGKVGTGFDRATLRTLGAQLRALRATTSPFADAPRDRDATWVEPRSSRQVGFTEWTARPPAPPALPRAARRQGRPEVVRETVRPGR